MKIHTRRQIIRCGMYGVLATSLTWVSLRWLNRKSLYTDALSTKQKTFTTLLEDFVGTSKEVQSLAKYLKFTREDFLSSKLLPKFKNDLPGLFSAKSITKGLEGEFYTYIRRQMMDDYEYHRIHQHSGWLLTQTEWELILMAGYYDKI